MPHPPELSRSGHTPVDPDHAEEMARVEEVPSTTKPHAPVPPGNRRGHHPEGEQDKPDLDDYAERIGARSTSSERRHAMPTKKEDLPGTIERSPAKAQRTYSKALDSAHEQYDSEERAHRVAYSALKHSFEKKGDHWEPKDEKGPSDPQAAKGGAEARRSDTPTGGGKDVGTTKKELMEQARELDIEGRSKMNKDELTRAVAKAKD